jgi:hypothetical protein
MVPVGALKTWMSLVLPVCGPLRGMIACGLQVKVHRGQTLIDLGCAHLAVVLISRAR